VFCVFSGPQVSGLRRYLNHKDAQDRIRAEGSQEEMDIERLDEYIGGLHEPGSARHDGLPGAIPNGFADVVTHDGIPSGVVVMPNSPDVEVPQAHHHQQMDGIAGPQPVAMDEDDMEDIDEVLEGGTPVNGNA
jgi:hypothetical protein